MVRFLRIVWMCVCCNIKGKVLEKVGVFSQDGVPE